MKGLIFKHYLLRSLTEPVGILIVTGLPTVLITILTLVFMGQLPPGAREYIEAAAYNPVATHIAIMFMVSFQFFGGSVLLDYIHMDFRGDRRWRMFAMPVRPSSYMAGVLAACTLFSMVQGGIVIAISSVAFNVHWGNPWVLLATLAACSALAQLIWILMFLVFPKKGTVEAAGQIITWGMMFASGWIGVNVYQSEYGEGYVEIAGSGVFENFISQYGTPISLARNAIRDSGIGNDMSAALVSLGVLYGMLAVLAVVVAVVGRRKGFSPGKSTVAATALSKPDKKLLGSSGEASVLAARADAKLAARKDAKIFDVADISGQGDLVLTTPTKRGGRLTIYKFALLRAIRNPVSLALNAVLPLLLLSLPLGWLWGPDAYMGLPFIGVAIMYGAFVAARGILNDKLDGTLVRIMSTPVNTLRYLSQNLLAAMTPLTLQILAVGFIGAALNRWDMDFALRLMLLYFLFAAASVAFSFAWSCLFKDKETSYAIFSVLMSLVAMLGGFFMPLEILPNALRVVGALFPAFWVSNGFLYLGGDGGAAIGSYWISVLIIVLFTVLYMVFGSKRRMI